MKSNQNTPTDSKELECKTKEEGGSALSELKKSFTNEMSVEAKAQAMIDFMKDTLSHGKTQCFKDFWEAKRLCMDLFKEPLNPIVRSKLWKEFTELTTEAKRFKSVLDEQASFAASQIELALDAAQTDLDNYDILLKQAPLLEIPEIAHGLIADRKKYEDLQRNLFILTKLATRLTSLRKEVIHTDMRIRLKNKLLQKISKLGDQIFPKRKILMKEISEAYLRDVQLFESRRFKESVSDVEKQFPLYIIRSEIKFLQGFSKALSLSGSVFHKTREILSRCWEEMRDMDKRQKKEFSLKTEDFKQNYELIREKITALEKLTESEKEISYDSMQDKVSQILQEMRTLELSRDGVKALKSSIQRILDKNSENVDAKKREKQKATLEKREAVKTSLEKVIKTECASTSENLQIVLNELQQDYEDLKLFGPDAIVYEQLLQDLTALVFDKQEEEAIDSTNLDALEDVYKHRVQQCNTIKHQVEECRRELGGSGFNFEKAMVYREYIDTGKERLDLAQEKLLKLEDKIANIHG
ncbi:MAG: hypothetical protein KAR79_00495 [Simkaniaceae bacterium]|nr:hypothetical protein [Simkaniaceae bacterium]